VFINRDKSLIISLYVDDMIILGRSLDKVNLLKKRFRKLYKLKDMREISTFLGLEITRDRASRTLTVS
jgi:hypothetical protein